MAFELVSDWDDAEDERLPRLSIRVEDNELIVQTENGDDFIIAILDDETGMLSLACDVPDDIGLTVDKNGCVRIQK